MSELREEQLSVFSVLFTCTSADEWEQATNGPSWARFCAGASPDLAAGLARVPAFGDYRHFRNRILTPGIPGALPPVESLYKDWGGHRAGLQHGQGFYLGDSARHVRAVCDALGLEVPREYQAMPDHVVLLLELCEYLRENAPAGDGLDFARHHFDWLDDYRSALAARMEGETDAVLAETAVFYDHVLAYLKEYVSTQSLLREARDVVAAVDCSKGRSTEEVILHG